VSCTSCGIPSGATVVDVSPYLPVGSPGSTPYRIVISAPTTSSGSSVSLTFSNTAYTTSGNAYLYSSLRPLAGPSDGGKATYGYNSGTQRGTGTCIQVGSDTDASSPGLRAVNASCYGHEIQYAFDFAGPLDCANCIAEGHAEIDDLGQTAILVRGSSGELALSNSNLSQSGGVVIDAAGNCVQFGPGNVDAHTTGTIALLAVNGCFSTVGLRAATQNASDIVLESGTTQAVTGAITGSVASKTNVYFENSTVAAAVSCVNNLFDSAPCENRLPADLNVAANLYSVGSVPTCGTGCTGVTGTNNAFEVTASTTGITSVTVNFSGSGFTNTPSCVVSRTNSGTLRAALTAIAGNHVTIGFSSATTAAEVDDVICFGH